jgi:hypothetical protein
VHEDHCLSTRNSPDRSDINRRPPTAGFESINNQTRVRRIKAIVKHTSLQGTNCLSVKVKSAYEMQCILYAQTCEMVICLTNNWLHSAR